MKICFASHNENKVKEIRSVLENHFEIISLDELGITEEIPETGTTLAENSLLKARFVWETKQIPVFSDDTGLEVDALKGEPGVYSARYAGPEKDPEANMDLLLQKLTKFNNRSARFKTVITWIYGNNVQQFTGTVEGLIGTKKAGDQGFGYDPLFYPEGRDITFAQMSLEEKNTMSHRARAFQSFKKYLEDNYL